MKEAYVVTGKPKKKMRAPGSIQRVNVDFTVEMLAEIDREVALLDIPRQAWIKMRIADVLAARVRKAQ